MKYIFYTYTNKYKILLKETLIFCYIAKTTVVTESGGSWKIQYPRVILKKLDKVKLNQGTHIYIVAKHAFM